MKTHGYELADINVAVSLERPRAMMPWILCIFRQSLRSSMEHCKGRLQKFQSHPAGLIDRMPRKISREKNPSLAPK